RFGAGDDAAVGLPGARGAAASGAARRDRRDRGRRARVTRASPLPLPRRRGGGHRVGASLNGPSARAGITTRRGRAGCPARARRVAAGTCALRRRGLLVVLVVA